MNRCGPDFCVNIFISPPLGRWLMSSQRSLSTSSLSRCPEKIHNKCAYCVNIVSWWSTGTGNGDTVDTGNTGYIDAM